jgi:hypothetical protein
VIFSGHADGSQSLSCLTHPFVVQGLSAPVILDFALLLLPTQRCLWVRVLWCRLVLRALVRHHFKLSFVVRTIRACVSREVSFRLPLVSLSRNADSFPFSILSPLQSPPGGAKPLQLFGSIIAVPFSNCFFS